MAADGVFSTPSDAILWAIYTDLHGSTTRGADLESGQFNKNSRYTEFNQQLLASDFEKSGR